MESQLQIASRTDRLRLIATADNHLGDSSTGLSPARLEARRAALRRSLAEVVDGAIRERVDLFLQAGDLFDAPDPPNAERAFVAGELARLRAAGIPVLAIGGCRDTPRYRLAHGGETPHEVFARLDALTLLSDPPGAATAGVTPGISTARVGWGDHVIAVGGLTWIPTTGAGRDPLGGLVWQPAADPRILLIHHAVEGHGGPAADEPLIARESLERLAVSLVIAGHVHRPGILHGRPGPTIVIPGATERLTFDGAEDDPGYWLIELHQSGEIVAADRRAVASQPRRDLVIATEDLPTEEPGRALQAILDPVCRPDILVRLRLRGPIHRAAYQALKVRSLIAYGQARAFAFELDTSGLYLADEGGLAAAQGARHSLAEEIGRIAAACHESDPDPLWTAARDRILADLAERTEVTP